MDEALISIIIPIYKVEKYLRRCLDSVLCQTYKNLEIILVDDGSPDRCGKICDEYAQSDSRIKVYHKDNGGLSDARNYGVERAHGDYITFIDSDDYVAPNYIEYLYILIDKYKAEISVCCMIQTDSDTVDYPINELLPEEQILTGYEACERLLDDMYLTLVTACGKLYARQIAKSYIFPVGKNHEDEATTCKYYYSSKKVVIGNRCLYAYYKNNSSITNTQGEEFNFDAEWALEHRALFFEENEEKELAQLAWGRLFYFYVNDSDKHNRRSDKYIKDLGKKGELSDGIKLRVWVYNHSRCVFGICSKLCNIIKNR